MFRIIEIIWIVIDHILHLVLNRALEGNYIALAVVPFVGIAS